MKKNTESFPLSSQHIDKLSNKKALKVMLENHNEAITAINKEIVAIENVIEPIFNRLSKFDNSRLIYVGAGASGRIAIQDAIELYPTFGWPKNRVSLIMAGGLKALIESVEGAEDKSYTAEVKMKKIKVKNEDVVIGLAASGSTNFTVKCIDIAKNLGALTIGIGNNKNGLLQSKSELPITLDTGSEIVAGSTRLKAGTAQKICINLISTLVMTRLGFVKNGLMINLIPTNNKLEIRRQQILKELKYR